MNLNYILFTLAALISFVKATKYTFNVVSILGEGYTLGVKYNKKVVELKSTVFPLFNGTIKADHINKYKYVALKDGKVVEEEKLTRTYTKKTKKNK